uniref:Phosphoglucosamine mutase n=1 Tax=uncultured prokaryote TaxID=198431 RepID=A0A0H5Q2R0_9ZZZZ|nr:hypothetical protein [uncultured prokaryote]
MGIFFGTDGVRGVVNNDLTEQLAQMVGNALARKKKKALIIVGRDTRISGCYMTAALMTGALKGGANVIDVGIVPTAAISYLVKHKKADFGVMISASHNPKQYNGIKIFDASGRKLSEKEEAALERFFACPQICQSTKVGKSKHSPSLAMQYIKFLLAAGKNLQGLKIVLDCANGAAYKIAPRVFKELGAEIVKLSCNSSGKKINEGCGSTNVEELRKRVLAESADAGFAYDGDADRLIAVDEKGQVLDGDQIIYILAKEFASNGELNSNTVVGTSHTNTGLLVALNRRKINLIRTDIGDKYVIEALEKMNLSLGAPIEVAEKTYICAGTTLCENTQPQDFVIGRVKPTVKENRASQYLKER